MVERLFRFLFKYPPLVFQQGDFAWGVSRPVLLAVAGRRRPSRRAALLTYRGVAGDEPPRDRVVLVGLRLAALARAARSACSGPTLILKAAVPQQNFLGVLVDDSRSMTIADRDGQPRSDVRAAAARPARTRRCSTALSQRFVAALLPVLVVGRSRRRRPPT